MPNLGDINPAFAIPVHIFLKQNFIPAILFLN
ncbi:hypothetical protein VIM7927_03419 [Vibrio mangrovi]|uniref:Uncharacterized protein n=1 Tax=Vibrio mangrovi TaxID=474394 RepID=A0A1Y6IWQ2_9VIBR|nr:hypothetical protein VIM7927_03419 [Vibrio mangrovi]